MMHAFLLQLGASPSVLFGEDVDWYAHDVKQRAERVIDDEVSDQHRRRMVSLSGGTSHDLPM